MSFKTRSYRAWFLIGVLTLGFTTPAMAILGIGDIVYDPTNFEEALQQMAELERQYQQLVQNYDMLANQYQHMLRMAQRVPVDMAARYKALASPWTSFSAGNSLGTSGSWSQGVNSGQNIMDAYSAATISLGTYGSLMGNLPVDHQANLKAGYSTLELTDGANIAGMQTVGRLRNAAPSTESALENLETDSFSSDPSTNTEVGVLNKINAASLLNARNTQNANQLLVALAEERILQAKAERDAAAQAFNDHIRFITDAKALLAAQTQGASDAMLAWRMP